MFESSKLFTRTLGKASNSKVEEAAINRLRACYMNTRQRVSYLLRLIPNNIPFLTIHDLSHIDALWHITDFLSGDNYPVNPAEGFVLGCSFLLHDAGMIVAAYPGGEKEIRTTNEWKDAYQYHLKSLSAGPGEWAEIKRLAEAHALADVLRARHAEKAEELATMVWPDGTSEQQALIEDSDLRKFYGRTIGKIAYSHCKTHEVLLAEFQQKLGAIPGFPPEWTVDPLKLACLLRVADAAHINAERAPHFHRVILKPTGISDDHWNFQSKLLQPYFDPEDTIVFHGQVFTEKDIPAWWLANDAIKMLDTELKCTNDLLADTDSASFPRPQLRARKVRGAGAPDILSQLIPTKGWAPVDTTVSVSDPVTLIENLGGKKLYGDLSWIPLRELLQNAVDAINARRSLDSQTFSPKIRVILQEDPSGWSLSVMDNGIGMSKRVIAGELVKFGKSLWKSTEVRSEHPGLLGSSFAPIGQFGIGFFSVFMVSERVTVISRKYDEHITHSLDFYHGLRVPAVLREIPSSLQNDFNTMVTLRVEKRVALSMSPTFPWPGYLVDHGTLPAILLHSVITIAPAVSVDIEVIEPAGAFLIPANFWLFCGDIVFHYLVNISKGNGLKVLESIFSLICRDSNISKMIYCRQGDTIFTTINSSDNAGQAVGKASILNEASYTEGYSSMG